MGTVGLQYGTQDGDPVGSIRCTLCESGSGPNPGQTACVACEMHAYSASGQCMLCGPSYIVNADKTTCTACSEGQKPNVAGAGTECVPCAAGKYSEFGRECKDCVTAGSPLSVQKHQVDNPCKAMLSSDAAACDGPSGPAEWTKRVGCGACDPGWQPNGSQDNECVRCTGHTYSMSGVCFPCDSKNVVHDMRRFTDEVAVAADDREEVDGQFAELKTACTACSAGRAPNIEPYTIGGDTYEVGTQCVACTGHTYSTSGECMECDSTNIVEAGQTKCTACKPGSAPNVKDFGTQCLKCELGKYSAFGERCATCDYPSRVIVDEVQVSQIEHAYL
jgi:hypothetical protein